MKQIQFLTVCLTLIFFGIGCNQQSEEKSYNSEAIELNKKAMFLARNNYRDNEALNMLEKAIKIDPSYYLSHTNKANIYTWRKEYKKALVESEISLKLNPNIPQRWFTTGLLLEKTGNRVKADKYYKKSIRIFNTQLEKSSNELDRNSIIFNRALSKFFTGDESYLDDFKTLKETSNYNSVVDEFEGKTRDQLLNELL